MANRVAYRRIIDELLERMRSFSTDSCPDNITDVTLRTESIYNILFALYSWRELKHLSTEACQAMLDFLRQVVDILLRNNYHNDACYGIMDTRVVDLLTFFSTSFDAHIFKPWIQANFQKLIPLGLIGTGQSIHAMFDASYRSYCDSAYHSVPNPELVRLLVEFGRRDANERDLDGKTPLRILSEWIFIHHASQISPMYTHGDLTDLETIAQILLDNGAHMDMVCSKGQEAAQYLSRLWPRFSFYKTLQCLASSAILKNNLPYKHLPKNMVRIVELHIKPEMRKHPEDKLKLSNGKQRYIEDLLALGL